MLLQRIFGGNNRESSSLIEQKCPIPGLTIFTPKVFEDNRGFLFESFRDHWLPDYSFVQENHSSSKKGVLRGLHYQLKNPQGKLVRVTKGNVFDVAVDIRKSSKTFGHYFSTFLDAKEKKMIWIPPGFAHGFLVVSETAELIYKCTNYYEPNDQNSIQWNDHDINIDWPLENRSPILSNTDKRALALSSAQVFP